MLLTPIIPGIRLALHSRNVWVVPLVPDEGARQVLKITRRMR